MTKTEELRGTLVEAVYDFLGGDMEFEREGGFHPVQQRAEEIVDDAIMPNLIFRGCGFKVEKELPEPAKEELRCKVAARRAGIDAIYFDGYGDGYEGCQNDILRVGFVGFEPIEEVGR